MSELRAGTNDGSPCFRLKPLDGGNGGFRIEPVEHPAKPRRNLAPLFDDEWSQRLGAAFGGHLETGMVISWRRLRDAVKRFATGETWAAHSARCNMKWSHIPAA